MIFDYYSLLISATPDKWDKGSALVPADRYLEHTVEAVCGRFRPLDDAVIQRLIQMPALFAYEKNVHDPRDIRVGRITRIQHRTNGYFLTFEFDEQMPPLSPQLLEDLREELDIEVRGGELNRSHWAIKEVHLYDVLRRHGIQAHLTGTSSTAGKPAPHFAAGLAGLSESIGAVGAAVNNRLARNAGGRVLSRDEAATNPANMNRVASLQAGERARVFIVHGRADGLKEEVARFLTQIGIEPVILHERPNGGRTLIAKFQEESADVQFAVVLMTPDDVGGLGGRAGANPLQPRARQNVIFELGFFIGRLGAERVCALVQDELEKPSDFDAVVYVKYDGPGGWKQSLVRELAHVGVPHDTSRLFGAGR